MRKQVLPMNSIPIRLPLAMLLATAVFLAAQGLSPQSLFAAGHRYTARLEDGSHHAGNRIHDWYDHNKNPHLDGRRLLDDGNPMMWLRDSHRLPAPMPDAYIEMVGGDRLPGEVVGFRQSSVDLEDQPRHFLFAPTIRHTHPKHKPEPTVRILEKYVRRVVWQSQVAAAKHTPGTLFFRDGRQLRFRQARFGDGFCSLLLNGGRQRVVYGEIGEIHLPTADPWETYFSELAVLSPQGKSRLLQIETSEGAVVTASRRRFRAAANGNNGDPDYWIHGVQPAWCLETLWLQGKFISVWRMWAPHRPPLSRFPAESVKRQAGLSGAAAVVRTNRNVRRGILESGDKQFGWGLGLHAHQELRFTLSPLVRRFRTELGLDRLAGDGGCVRARVFLDSINGQRLYESPFLVGSRDIHNSGDLEIRHTPNRATTLVLQTDSAHEGRPAGADPLDIRDMFNWLDPRLTLDEADLLVEIQRRIPESWHALANWRLRAAKGSLEVVSLWDETHPMRFRTGLHANQADVFLSRHMRIRKQDTWLMLSAYVFKEDGDQPRLEVFIAGNPVGEFEVPVRKDTNPEPLPMMLPISAYRGHEIDLEIRQIGEGQTRPVVWSAIRPVDQLPMLYRAFEDEGRLVLRQDNANPEKDPPQEAKWRLVNQDQHSGKAALEVTPGGRFQLQFDKPIKIRRRPKYGEYRHVRFAFRKYGEGQIRFELDHADSQDQPILYDAGPGVAAHKRAKRVWTPPLPKEWIIITRDLSEDYAANNLEIRSITFSGVGGGRALLDHVYFARSEDDFKLLSSAAEPDQVNAKARLELARGVAQRVQPLLVQLDVDGRHGTGVSLGKSLILTTAHLIAGDVKRVQVTLASGKQFDAEVAGFDRGLDCGLVRLPKEVELEGLEFSPSDPDPAAPYLGISFLKDPESGQIKPEPFAVTLKQVFRETIWTQGGLPGISTGGPLIDMDGTIVGLYSRPNRYGGLLYTRGKSIRKDLHKIKSERRGSWIAGAGPMLGVVVTSTLDGCHVDEVYKDSPAAAADIQVKDLIQKFNGRSVVSLADMYSHLADVDPGTEVTVDIQRGKEQLQRKMRLMHRIP